MVQFDLSKARGSLVPAETFPKEAEQTFVIYTNMILDALNHEIPAGLLNHTIWKIQSDPEVPLLALDRELWDENQFVPWIQSSEGKWVDIVVNNLDQQGHPFHLVSQQVPKPRSRLTIMPSMDMISMSYPPASIPFIMDPIRHLWILLHHVDHSTSEIH
jgi:hypothetical protein